MLLASPLRPPAPGRNRRRLAAALAAAAVVAAGCSVRPDTTVAEPDTTVTAGNDPAAGGLGDDAGTASPDTTAPAGPGDKAGPVGQTDDPQPGGPGGGQAGGEQPGPGETADGPGTAGPGDPVGPVAQTGALIPGDDVPFTWLVTGRAVRDQDGNITYPGGKYGGFWWLPESRWQAVLNEIFDLCDDNDAYAAAIGIRLGPGDEIDPIGQKKISSLRLGRGVTCEPGGRRYVYVTEGGPGPIGTSPQDAIEQLSDAAKSAPGPKDFTGPPGVLQGYKGHYYHVESPADEVVVLPESVTVSDGTIRGLIQNQSRTQWARDATVTADGQQWKWPLTMQPEEAAPFEIPNWAGTTDPTAIELQVTANLSPAADITRAIGFPKIISWYGTWDEYLNQRFPTTAIPETPDGAFTYIEAIMKVRVPTSHPELAHQINHQTINDLKAYVAFLEPTTPGTGPPVKVTEVTEITPYEYIWETPNKTYEVTSLPNTRAPYGPYDFLIGFAEHGPNLIWTGGAQ